MAQIRAGMPDQWTLDDLADAAKRGIGTWHGWNNGSHAPKLLEFDDFARAVGLTVGLIRHDALASVPNGTVLNSTAEATVVNQLLVLAEQIEQLPERAQQRIVDTVRGMLLSEAAHASNPSEPAEADSTSAPSSRRK